jgi:metastasis suppressor protein 1
LKLQKKAKRGTFDNLQSLVDTSMMNVHQQKAELDDIERTFLRNLMVEDRMRYCYFVNILRPVVKEEYEMMYEIGHLQEAMQTVDNVTKDPSNLPQSSEELISEAKPSYNFNIDSPTHSTSQLGLNSIGSRKSSICSISSINSSGSYDSLPACYDKAKISTITSTSSAEQASTTSPYVIKTKLLSNYDRPQPHTISAVYEKGHQRLSLTQQTFNSPPGKFTESPPVQNSPKKPPIPVVS